jgi:hypothetical protein
MSQGKTTLRTGLAVSVLFLAGCLFGGDDKEPGEVRTYTLLENVTTRDTVYDFTYVAGFYDSTQIFPWFQPSAGDSLLFAYDREVPAGDAEHPGSYSAIFCFLAPSSDSLRLDSVAGMRAYLAILSAEPSSGSRKILGVAVTGWRVDARSYHAEGRVTYAREKFTGQFIPQDTPERDTLTFSGTFRTPK